MVDEIEVAGYTDKAQKAKTAVCSCTFGTIATFEVSYATLSRSCSVIHLLLQ